MIYALLVYLVIALLFGLATAFLVLVSRCLTGGAGWQELLTALAVGLVWPYIVAGWAWQQRKRAITWLMGTWFWRHVLCWLVRTIRLPTLTRTCPPFAYEVGDWLLCGNPWKLQHHLVPGTWEHGAVIVRPGLVAEFTAHGFTFTNLDTWRGQYTRVLVLRPRYADRDAAFRRLEDMWGAPYDDRFQRGPDSVYCFEMLALMAPEIRLDWSDLAGLGQPYVNGDDIEASPDVEVVFDSRRKRGDVQGMRALAEAVAPPSLQPWV